MRNRRHSSAWIPALGPLLSSAARPTLEIRESRERKISLRVLYFSLLAVIVALLPSTAHAYPGGIAGYSGKTGVTCTQCHSSGTPPKVTMALPASVNSGATYTLTLTAVGASGNGGLGRRHLHQRWNIHGRNGNPVAQRRTRAEQWQQQP
jgi:hypothetical protein